MAKNLIDIWFVSNPATQKVEQVLMIGPLGMSKRENREWIYVNRDEANLADLSTMKIYDYDWSSDSAPLPSNYSDEDLLPEPVKAFDQGDLTVAALDGRAHPLYDGTSED
jgi:hypothetical protein